ncbi:MAG: hypothetical protein RR993_01235, partial [Clostridia bacterium]
MEQNPNQNQNQNQNQRPRPVSPFAGIGLMMQKMSIKTVIIILSVITAGFVAFNIYFGFMEFSIFSTSLRTTLIAFLVLWSIPFIIKFVQAKDKSNASTWHCIKEVKHGWKIPAVIAAVLLVIFLCLAVFSSPLFIAKDYRNIITVNDNMDFKKDIVNYDDPSMKIAVVDKDMAMRLGEKQISNNNYGSQFTINNYTMIYLKNEAKGIDDIYWVGALDYTGFFKWWNNRSTGAPGYVMISATNPDDVSFVKMDMKYVPGAYLNQDAERKMYFTDMSKLRYGEMSFEIDNDGNPYFLQVCYERTFAATNGLDSTGVFLLNAVTGESKYYANENVPEWVDRVQPTAMINQQLDYWGAYNLGFWNTVFAKREMMNTTDTYNYLYQNGSFKLITGMTSTAGDNALVGMILTDMRTKETSFYRTGGATDKAAMSSAEGKVQDLKYKASAPTLLNFNGEPTYFMTLKDNAGLIKKYAYVSVKQYNNVGIGDTKREAEIEYAKAIGSVIETESETLTVSAIEKVFVDGSTVFYIQFAEKGNTVYTAELALNKQLPFVKANNKLKVSVDKKTL